MKGIILAGGSGTRLYPITKTISKQLLPVYDKPMIYYPLSVLMLAGIRDIMIIATEQDVDRYEQLLGSGSDYGINLSYAVQPVPGGIPQAFIIASDYIGEDKVSLILGDNIFFGQGFTPLLKKVARLEEGATIFVYKVNNPEQFGVVEFDDDFRVLSIEEKPLRPKSKYVVTGLYFYDHLVVEYAKKLKPSERGELEITDLNKVYLQEGKLRVELLGRGFAWFDTGTHEALLEASQFVETIERRQGFKIACIEEIAYFMEYINREQLVELARPLLKNSYGEYLMSLTREMQG